MGVVDLAVVPTGRGSSQTEDPGSSLDMAGRADTEQGNRTSTLANTADADSVEEPGQEDDADSPAARTVAEKHERDEDLDVLPSSTTMAGAETSGQASRSHHGNAARRRFNDTHLSSASRRLSSTDTRVQQPQNIPVRRTKQMVRLWLIFVIVALISEAISYIVNYPTTHYTRIDPIWAATIIFSIDAACFAAGMLWLGRGS